MPSMLKVVLLCVLLVVAPVAAHAIDPAGTVDRLQGAAVAHSTTGFSRPLQVGSTILVGDRVSTNSGGRLRLQMKDGGVITLGENSVMTIENYDDDTTTGGALLNFAEGVFLLATGVIAQLGPNRVIVSTPVATLGIRGTDVWGQQDSSRLQVAMLAGVGVTVTTPQGSVEMTDAESGVTVQLGEAPPEPKAWSPERLDAARQTVAFAE